MTLPVYTNPISLSDIEAEFGGTAGPLQSGTRFSIALGSYYAGGAYVSSRAYGYPSGNLTKIPSSGGISLNNFYGASARTQVTFTISANTQSPTIAFPIPSGAGFIDATLIINTGIYVYGYEQITALTVGSDLKAGDTLTIINNGFIMGGGGIGGGNGLADAVHGGTLGTFQGKYPPTKGGDAIDLKFSATIRNNGYIGGGGGGGGYSHWVTDSSLTPSGNASPFDNFYPYEVMMGGGNGAGRSASPAHAGNHNIIFGNAGQLNFGFPDATGNYPDMPYPIYPPDYMNMRFNDPLHVDFGAVGGTILSPTATGGAGATMPIQSMTWSNEKLYGTSYGARTGGAGGGGGVYFAVPTLYAGGDIVITDMGGGAGGSGNSAGGNGYSPVYAGYEGAGGGGGWGAAGGAGNVTNSGTPGAAGGKAINLNGHIITISSGATRIYGAMT